MTPQLPQGLTAAQYHAQIEKVILEGRKRIDKARQAAKAHLESQAVPKVGITESGGGGDDNG